MSTRLTATALRAMLCTFCVAVATRASVAQSEAAAPKPAQWTFDIEPYIWLPSLTGRGSAESSPSVDVDLVGALDAALPLALRVDAPNERYSLMLDGLFARWRDDEGAVQTKTTFSLVEGGFGLPLNEQWDFIAGLRAIELGFEVEIGPAQSRAEASWIDPWLGARAELELGQHWELRLRGDIGGFGVGSDFSWQAVALVAWQFATHWRLDLGYRALAVDFSDDDLDYDLLAHGPLLGLVASF